MTYVYDFNKHMKNNRFSELHRITQITFLFCRCIGVFPVEGLFQCSVEKIRYLFHDYYLRII